MASKTLASIALLLSLTLLCLTFVSCDSSASTVDNTSTKTWDSSLTKQLIEKLQSIEDSLISFKGNLTNPVLKEAVEAVISSLSWLIKELKNAGNITDLQEILKSVLGSLSGLIKALIKTLDIPAISKIVVVLKPIIDVLTSLIKLFAPQDTALLNSLKFLSFLLKLLTKKVAIVAPQLVGQLKPLYGSLSLLIQALAG